MTTFVGGVSELFQGDLDVGRRIAESLAAEDLGPDALVEDLHYGAVAVAQRLQDVQPDRLVLVGAVKRDRPPATVERRFVDRPDLPDAVLQHAVGDAVTGYVAIDLIVEILAGFGAFPRRVVSVEVEPAMVGPTDQMSPEVTAAVDELTRLVRTEIVRAPVFYAVDELTTRLDDGHLDPSPARDALRSLVRELGRADRDGRWGATSSLRDALQAELSAGNTSEAMDHADWGLAWGLIEGLGTAERAEASGFAST